MGEIGENCACEYLKKNGFSVVERNYLKKWGEIDIVAKKGKKIHFVEVKSVSREFMAKNKEISDGKNVNVSRETSDGYRPEDNMHPWKLKRLGRAVQSYLLDRNVPDDVDWQFDLMTVYLDMERRMSRVFVLGDVVL